MAEINLLPWRAMNRAENKRKKKLFLIYFTALTIVWFVSHIGLSLIAHAYDTTISDLKNQLTELSSQTKPDHFNSSLSIVKQIRSSQLELVNFFAMVEKATQEKLILSEITGQKNKIILTGNVDSLSMLSHFVNAYNIKNKSSLMTIVNVKKNDDISAIQFRLQLVRTPLLFLGQIKDDAE